MAAMSGLNVRAYSNQSSRLGMCLMVWMALRLLYMSAQIMEMMAINQITDILTPSRTTLKSIDSLNGELGIGCCVFLHRGEDYYWDIFLQAGEETEETGLKLTALICFCNFENKSERWEISFYGDE